MKIKAFICVLLVLAGFVSAAPPDRDTRMAWWRESRFGMFVTYGLYSSLAGTWNGEPIRGKVNFEHAQRLVNADTYTYAAATIPGFQPKQDFATAWAKLARQAGCEYVIFTTKFHDGFALHDSKLTQFDAGDVMNRDLVREITEALRKEGLRVGFYHSVIDWHHPQYDYTRATQPNYPKDGIRMTHGPRDHNRYIEFLHGQVNELISNYGKVDLIWWDYSGFGFDGDEAWKATDLMNLCRDKQPHIIMNNRLFRRPEAGYNIEGGADISRPLDEKFGDFGTPEQYVPDGFNAKMNWETCMTMNNTWGYSEHDQNWKSAETIIRNLIDIASKGGNYLLNIGPKADGSIPQQSIAIMTATGKWMDTNAESIRGTTRSPIGMPNFDGRITTKGKTHYLHLFTRPANGTISVPLPGSKAVLLDGGQSLKLSQDGGKTVIHLPPAFPDSVASVIRLE